jgi:hypothetical protein
MVDALHVLSRLRERKGPNAAGVGEVRESRSSIAQFPSPIPNRVAIWAPFLSRKRARTIGDLHHV